MAEAEMRIWCTIKAIIRFVSTFISISGCASLHATPSKTRNTPPKLKLKVSNRLLQCTAYMKLYCCIKRHTILAANHICCFSKEYVFAVFPVRQETCKRQEAGGESAGVVCKKSLNSCIANFYTRPFCECFKYIFNWCSDGTNTDHIVQIAKVGQASHSNSLLGLQPCGKVLILGYITVFIMILYPLLTIHYMIEMIGHFGTYIWWWIRVLKR